MILLLGLGAALAAPADSPPVDASVGGDVKSFVIASFPYDNALFMPDAPQGTAALSGRLKVEADAQMGAVKLDLQAHQTLGVLALPPASGSAGGGVGFGSVGGAEPPQAVDLSWDLVTVEGQGNLAVSTRTDRLALSASIPHASITVGRQPITFGRALFFTPLDLVNPFSPTVIDQEYKPGVDAVRVDGYAGTATTGTLAIAHAGDWDLAGTIAAAYGQTTVGLWDIGAFLGAVHGDGVLGFSGSGSIGPVGLRAEATGTVPGLLLEGDGSEDPFVRAVVGADVRPTGTTSVSAELYVQTNGATNPADYLAQAQSARVARGELWTLGRSYAALTVGQEIVPTVTASAFVVANLEDPSALIGPALAWSVAENSSLSAGLFAGLGERPGGAGATIQLNSEFGLVPMVGFVQLASYF